MSDQYQDLADRLKRKDLETSNQFLVAENATLRASLAEAQKERDEWKFAAEASSDALKLVASERARLSEIVKVARRFDETRSADAWARSAPLTPILASPEKERWELHVALSRPSPQATLKPKQPDCLTCGGEFPTLADFAAHPCAGFKPQATPKLVDFSGCPDDRSAEEIIASKDARWKPQATAGKETVQRLKNGMCQTCGEAPNLIPAHCCADRKDRYECETPGCTVDTMTLEAWNRRTPDPATQRVLEAAKDVALNGDEGARGRELRKAVEALAGREKK